MCEFFLRGFVGQDITWLSGSFSHSVVNYSYSEVGTQLGSSLLGRVRQCCLVGVSLHKPLRGMVCVSA